MIMSTSGCTKTARKVAACDLWREARKNTRDKGMNFEEFQAWLSDKFSPDNGELLFETLGGRSYFYVSYDSQSRFMKIRRSTGRQGQLREDKIRRVFERYQNGSQSERNMTSFYTDPWWERTPSRILAPYVAAVIKAWTEEG